MNVLNQALFPGLFIMMLTADSVKHLSRKGLTTEVVQKQTNCQWKDMAALSQAMLGRGKRPPSALGYLPHAGQTEIIKLFSCWCRRWTVTCFQQTSICIQDDWLGRICLNYADKGKGLVSLPTIREAEWLLHSILIVNGIYVLSFLQLYQGLTYSSSRFLSSQEHWCRLSRGILKGNPVLNRTLNL